MIKNKSILIALIILLFSNLSFAENIFFIADDIDAAPYISANSDNKPIGLFYDIIENVFKRMGIPFKYEVYPWKRAQRLVQKKQADALITIPTIKRLEYLIPSHEPVFVMKYKIFTQSDNPNINKIKSIKNLSELNGLKIIDYIGDGWAEKNLNQFGVHWAPNLTSACLMLAGHRGDVFLQDEFMVLHAIKNHKDKETNSLLENAKIVSFDAPVAQINFHLLIHKESNFLYLLPKFDESVRSMHNDGTIDNIIKQLH